MARLPLALVMAACACGNSSHQEPPPAAPLADAHTAAQDAFYASTFSRRASVAEMTALGEQVFRDPGLSASGKLACASCHDPDHAFAPDAELLRGGPDEHALGVRAAPSLRYLQQVPAFTAHDTREDGSDQGPAGGLTWDGRVSSLHAQASSPLFSPLEMALASPDDLAARVRRAPYAAALRAAFSDDALATTASTVKATVLVLEVYQQREDAFYPYRSKFDAVARGSASFTPEEARGRAAFDDPARGNCASCHPSTASSGLAAFSDFGYAALGAPRNHELPATHDPAYVDLGLCGPYRTDLTTHPELCGMFRTPSLRNVATRRRWFHNGVFTSLAQVLDFYATRDVTPRRWYPSGAPDDLPAAYLANLERGAPFAPRAGKPSLSERDRADIIAFLRTLSDAPRAR